MSHRKAVLMRIEICQEHRQDLHSSQYWVENIQTGTHGLAADRKATSRTDHLWPEIWSEMSKAAQRKEKQEWASEKPELDHARMLWGIYFTNLEGTEFLETMKKRAEEELSLEAPMSCKIRSGQCKEICGKPYIHKWMYTRVVEAKESTRKRLEKLNSKIKKITLQRRGKHLWVITILCTSSCWCLKQWIFWKRRSWWTNGKSSRKCQHVGWLHWGHSGGTQRKKESPLCYVDGHLSSQERGAGTTMPKIHQKYQGLVVHRGVKDDSGCYEVFIHGVSASQITAAEVMEVTARLLGCAGQAVDAVSAYTQVDKECAPGPSKIPNSECADIWIRLPRHK